MEDGGDLGRTIRASRREELFGRLDTLCHGGEGSQGLVGCGTPRTALGYPRGRRGAGQALPVSVLSLRAEKPEARGPMTTSPSPIPRAQVFTGPSAEARAQQLGIPGGTAPLVAALRDGASAAKATTDWHPAPYKGQRMWAEAVARLASTLVKKPGTDWQNEAYHGVDLVANRRQCVAIIVTAGDSATGKEHYRPQVRFDRGDAVQGIVGGHLDQLWGPTPTSPKWEVWFLLHFLAADQLTGELSRPAGIGPGGYVTEWVQRIILPDTTFGGAKPGSRREDDAPPAVDVEVQRRTG